MSPQSNFSSLILTVTGISFPLLHPQIQISPAVLQSRTHMFLVFLLFLKYNIPVFLSSTEIFPKHAHPRIYLALQCSMWLSYHFSNYFAIQDSNFHGIGRGVGNQSIQERKKATDRKRYAVNNRMTAYLFCLIFTFYSPESPDFREEKGPVLPVLYCHISGISSLSIISSIYASCFTSSSENRSSTRFITISRYE